MTIDQFMNHYSLIELLYMSPLALIFILAAYWNRKGIEEKSKNKK